MKKIPWKIKINNKWYNEFFKTKLATNIKLIISDFDNHTLEIK